MVDCSPSAIRAGDQPRCRGWPAPSSSPVIRKRERALGLAGGDGLRGGGDEGGDGGLHVDGAAADQSTPSTSRPSKGSVAPGRRVAHRHHVGVAGEAEVGALRSRAGVEVLDALDRIALRRGNPAIPSALGEQVLRAVVAGGHGRGSGSAPGRAATGIDAKSRHAAGFSPPAAKERNPIVPSVASLSYAPTGQPGMTGRALEEPEVMAGFEQLRDSV